MESSIIAFVREAICHINYDTLQSSKPALRLGPDQKFPVSTSESSPRFTAFLSYSASMIVRRRFSVNAGKVCVQRSLKPLKTFLAMVCHATSSPIT